MDGIKCLAAGDAFCIPIIAGGAAAVPKKFKCKSCDKWYGAEDDDYGPCSIKHARGDKKFITHGEHDCDEIPANRG